MDFLIDFRDFRGLLKDGGLLLPLGGGLAAPSKGLGLPCVNLSFDEKQDFCRFSTGDSENKIRFDLLKAIRLKYIWTFARTSKRIAQIARVATVRKFDGSAISS